jgi:hypothetical protein
MGRRRPGKQLFPCYQRRGEWVELLFMTVASGLGFNVFKPWGEPPRYDVVIEHENRFLRIQVKSTEMWLGTCYLCQLHSYGRPRYTTKNVDYFAIYVFGEDIWYIFPAKELIGKRTIAVTPHLKGHKYEHFMENWWLLTRPHPKRNGQTQMPTEDKRTSIHRLTQRILKRMEGLGH